MHGQHERQDLDRWVEDENPQKPTQALTAKRGTVPSHTVSLYFESIKVYAPKS